MADMVSNPDLTYEQELWSVCKNIAGMDEAGRAGWTRLRRSGDPAK